MQTHIHTHCRLHAMSAGYTSDYLYKIIAEELDILYGIQPTHSGVAVSLRNLVSIVDSYIGLGYEKNTEEELG